MKKVIVLVSALLVSAVAFSQADSVKNKPLDRVIVEFGASPFSVVLADGPDIKSINYAVGYEISKRFDLRVHMDVNTYSYENSNSLVGIDYSSTKYTGVSLGVAYNLLDDMDFIYENSSLDILTKFGGEFNDHSEQESLFFDISTRLKMKDMPYVGIGYYYKNSDLAIDNIQGIYFSFGIEF